MLDLALHVNKREPNFSLTLDPIDTNQGKVVLKAQLLSKVDKKDSHLIKQKAN